MIETIVLNYLQTGLINTPVYMEEPLEKPKRYVLIEKTGGGKRNHIDTAIMAIQSYDKTLLDAAKLNNTIKHLMDNITELDSVSRCELNSDYNYTDVETRRYRYQAVYELTYFD